MLSTLRNFCSQVAVSLFPVCDPRLQPEETRTVVDHSDRYQPSGIFSDFTSTQMHIEGTSARLGQNGEVIRERAYLMKPAHYTMAQLTNGTRLSSNANLGDSVQVAGPPTLETPGRLVLPHSRLMMLPSATVMIAGEGRNCVTIHDDGKIQFMYQDHSDGATLGFDIEPDGKAELRQFFPRADNIIKSAPAIHANGQLSGEVDGVSRSFTPPIPLEWLRPDPSTMLRITTNAEKRAANANMLEPH